VTLACAEPNCAANVVADAPRCAKGHVLRRCPQCRTHNRSFANFCRSCSSPLPASPSNWTGSKGSARRLGFNASTGPAEWTVQKPALTLRLGDACRTLLACDGHLIAISLNGTIEVADPVRARSLCRFQTPGRITAEPCISNGALYVSTENQLTAYALGPMTLEPPRVRPLWQVPVRGTPIYALTPARNRLFATVSTGDWREVVVVEQTGQPPRATARTLHRSPKTSWLAADPATGDVVFLSEENGRIHLHVVRDDVTSHPVSLQVLAEQPIAFLGNAVFAVFGAARQLYRIDAATGAVEEPLETDTQLFALTHDDRGAWDRDGVRIDSDGVLFARSAVRDSFAPHERATKPSPVVMRGAAAAIGMEDGRVLLYELAHLPRHEVWRLDGHSTAPITALASYDGYVAAGNRDGVVEVRELRDRGAAR
jgi:hypothetical protein